MHNAHVVISNNEKFNTKKRWTRVQREKKRVQFFFSYWKSFEREQRWRRRHLADFAPILRRHPSHNKSCFLLTRLIANALEPWLLYVTQCILMTKCINDIKFLNIACQNVFIQKLPTSQPIYFNETPLLSLNFQDTKHNEMPFCCIFSIAE